MLVVFAKTGIDTWQPVQQYNPEGVLLSGQSVSLAQVWDGYDTERPPEQPVFRPWEELLPPLPYPEVRCHAYALTYPSHRAETGRSKSFFFPKGGPSRLMNGPIMYRPYLDYEIEIGVLIRRDNRRRYGYCLVNDLTDRGIQLLGRKTKKQPPRELYTNAKSFPGSLLVGPLLAVGDEEDWFGLEATLLLNGTLKQSLRARECSIAPAVIRRELSEHLPDSLWLFASSGTPTGIMLKVPSKAERIILLARARFSLEQARRLHLREQVFLLPGDRIEVRSPVLGIASSLIIDQNQVPAAQRSQ